LISFRLQLLISIIFICLAEPIFLIPTGVIDTTPSNNRAKSGT
jgi:hypothetical protein